MKEADTAQSAYYSINQYTDISKMFLNVINDPSIIYGGGTNGIVADAQFGRKPDGSLSYEPFTSSGMYIFFPSVSTPASVKSYHDEITQAQKYIEDERINDFLSSYMDTVSKYALISETGRTVTNLANDGMDKADIDYDSVKEYCQKNSIWDILFIPIFDYLGGENVYKDWLDQIIRLQAAEAVVKENVTAQTIQKESGTGYAIVISDAKKRVIDSVNMNIIAELPATQKYLEQNPDMAVILAYYPDLFAFRIGSVQAAQLSEWEWSDDPDQLLDNYLDWYNEDTSFWDLDPFEEKWYAIEDQNGNLHAVSPKFYDDGILITTSSQTDWGETTVYLFFSLDDGELLEVAIIDEHGAFRPMLAKDLTVDITCLPLRFINFYQIFEIPLPLSMSPVTISAGNKNPIRLVYTDIHNLTDDIQDMDGDGDPITKKYVVKDIYTAEIDITEQVEQAEEGFIHIELAEIPSAVYNGSEQSFQVILDGKVLEEGVDYEWMKVYDNDNFTDAGTYRVALFGTVETGYVGYTAKDFVITPAPINETSVSGVSDMVYTGNEITQVPTLVFGDLTLREGIDYTIEFSDNTDPGTAVIIIRGIGNFTGVMEITFNIKKEGIVVPVYTTPILSGKKEPVYTGYENHFFTWIILMFISASLFTVSVILKKKKVEQ